MYYLISEIKALISCMVTTQLICAFVFEYAKSRCSNDAALSIALVFIPWVGRFESELTVNPERHSDDEHLRPTPRDKDVIRLLIWWGSLTCQEDTLLNQALVFILWEAGQFES